MAELEFQKKVIGTLTEMKKSIETLMKDFDYLVEYIEDTKLTEEERKQLHASIDKVKARDTSDFVSLDDAKKELGL